MRIAITGSTGLVGSALSTRLDELGHDVVPVVRGTPGDGEIGWSVDEERIEDGAFDGLDAVVHLAGAPIAGKRWSDEYKREIRSSRIVGTALVADAVNAATDGPAVLLSGSAVGYYGTSVGATFTEDDAPGDGFLAETCVAWEAAAAPAKVDGTRVVHLRTGIVLSADDGALAKQLPLFRFGLGGTLGSGEQWQSWIHVDDEVGAIVHLLDSDVEGPVNLTAPNPVPQREFADTLGDVLHRPTFLPIPEFGPKLLLGSELAENLLFTGQRVLPSVLEADGYAFEHPRLEGALRDLLA